MSLVKLGKFHGAGIVTGTGGNVALYAEGRLQGLLYSSMA
jgi:hypothetical protein